MEELEDHPLYDRFKVPPTFEYQWRKDAELKVEPFPNTKINANTSIKTTICSGDFNMFGTRFLVSGGNFLTLFQKANKWISKWQHYTPNNIVYTEFSPDNRLFATFTSNCRLLKIWFMDNGKFISMFLPHNTVIISCQWRPKEINVQYTANAIMTLSVDNKVRLWNETQKNEDVTFQLSVILTYDSLPKSVSFLTSVHEYSYNEVYINSLKKRSLELSDDAGHLNKYLFFQEKTSQNAIDEIAMTGPPKKVNSLVSVIENDGTFIVYLIRGLSDVPRRTPIISVRLMCPKLFQDQSISQMMVNYKDVKGDTTYISWIPEEIYFYLRSTRGRLTSYRLMTQDADRGDEMTLHLEHNFTGHYEKVVGVKVHPILPLVCSVDVTGNIQFWHLVSAASTSGGINQPPVMTNLAQFDVINSPCAYMVWLESHNSVVVATSDGLKIVTIVPNLYMNNVDNSANVDKRKGKRKRVRTPMTPTENKDDDEEEVEDAEPILSDIFPPIPALYSVNIREDVTFPGDEDFRNSSFMSTIFKYKKVSWVENNNGREPTEMVVYCSILICLNKEKDTVGVWKVKHWEEERVVVVNDSSSGKVKFKNVRKKVTKFSIAKLLSKTFYENEEKEKKETNPNNDVFGGRFGGFGGGGGGMYNNFGQKKEKKKRYISSMNCECSNPFVKREKDLHKGDTYYFFAIAFQNLESEKMEENRAPWDNFGSFGMEKEKEEEKEKTESELEIFFLKKVKIEEPPPAPKRRLGLLARLNAEKSAKEKKEPTKKKEYQLKKWVSLSKESKNGKKSNQKGIDEDEQENRNLNKITSVKFCETLSRICIIYSQKSIAKIYESESTPGRFLLEEIIEIPVDNGEILSCKFFPFETGKQILAFSTRSKGVFVYTQIHVDERRSKFWQLMGNLRCNGIAGCLSISKGHLVLCPDGKNINVFSTKFCDLEEGVNDVRNKKELLRVCISNAQRKLPDYHPTILQGLLMGGKVETVKKCVIHLGESIKTYVMLDKNRMRENVFIPVEDVKFCLLEEEVVEKQEPTKKSGGLVDKYKFLQSKPSSPFEKDDVDEISEDEKKFVENFEVVKGNLSSKVRLPYLSGKTQMNLLSIMETAWQTHGKDAAAKSQSDYLDESAVRFLYAYTIMNFVNLTKKKPKDSNKDEETKMIKSALVAWTMHSETQKELIEMIKPKGKRPSWPLIRSTGVVYWVKNPIELRTIVQGLAQAQFSKKSDPTQCALLYLALKKKSTLIALFKAVQKTRLAEFYSRDFSINRNQVAASKNAMKLLGLRDFSYSAAFFLLGERIQDCIDVIVNKMNDVHLAFLVVRLYCGLEDEVTKGFIREHLIPKAVKDNDCWMKSICFWLLKEYDKSLECLIKTNGNQKEVEEYSPTLTFDESIYDYCEHILSLPFIQTDESCNEVLTKLEKRKLLSRVGYYLYKRGLDNLAMEYFRKIKFLKDIEKKSQKSKQNQKMINTGMIDFSLFDNSFGMGGGNQVDGFGGFGQPPMEDGGSKKEDVKKKEEIVLNEDFEELFKSMEYLKKFQISVHIFTFILENIKIFPLEIFEVVSKSDELVMNSEGKYHKQFFEHLKLIKSAFSLFVDRYEIMGEDLRKSINHYCKMNSNLIGKCLVSFYHNTKDQSSMRMGMKKVEYILKSEGIHKVVSIIPDLIHNRLTKVQVDEMEDNFRQYLFCFHATTITPVRRRGEFILVMYLMKFIISWCKRDFLALQLLFDLHKQKDQPMSKFFQYVYNHPLKYFKNFEKYLKHFKSEINLELQISKRKSKSYNNLSYLEKMAEMEEQAEIRKESDEVKLEKEFHWNFFNALILTRLKYLVFQFISNTNQLRKMQVHKKCETSVIERLDGIKDLDPDEALKQRMVIVDEEKVARNLKVNKKSFVFDSIVSGINSWSYYLEQKVHYTKMELMIVTKKTFVPRFREIETPSYKISKNSLLYKVVFSKQNFQIHRKKKKRKKLKEEKKGIYKKVFKFFQSVLGDTEDMEKKVEERLEKVKKYDLLETFSLDIHGVRTFDENVYCKRLWYFLTRRMKDEKMKRKVEK